MLFLSCRNKIINPMFRRSNLLIWLSFLPWLFSSCQLNEAPESGLVPDIAGDEVMAYPDPGTSCDFKGTSFSFNLGVTDDPAVGPQNVTNNFPYLLDLITQSFQVGGSDAGCPCKLKKYRLYFNTQAAAAQVQLYNSQGQSLPVPGAQANSSGQPGPWFIELTAQQLAARFWLRFATQSTPEPLMVHAGGYCIIDNIGGLGEPYTALSPLLVPTEEDDDEYNLIYFWPEDAFSVPEIP